MFSPANYGILPDTFSPFYYSTKEDMIPVRNNIIIIIILIKYPLFFSLSGLLAVAAVRLGFRRHSKCRQWGVGGRIECVLMSGGLRLGRIKRGLSGVKNRICLSHDTEIHNKTLLLYSAYFSSIYCRFTAVLRLFWVVLQGFPCL